MSASEPREPEVHVIARHIGQSGWVRPVNGDHDRAWRLMLREADGVIDYLRENGYVIRAIEDEAGALDAAWQEAEAALPEGRDLSVGTNRYGDGRYVAFATGSDEGDEIGAAGDSAAAALRALAARLRAAPVPEEG